MRRLVCLDGLRGALATYVMLSHTLPFAPTPGWLHWLFQHGGAFGQISHKPKLKWPCVQRKA